MVDRRGQPVRQRRILLESVDSAICQRMKPLALAACRLARRLAALAVVAFTVAAAPPPTTVRVELDTPSRAPSWFALARPDRLVIDLPGGRTLASTVTGDGPARRLRLAQFDRDTARLVVDLARPARIDRAVIDGRAVVLTLIPTTVADFARLARGGRFAAVPPDPVAPPRLPVIVIDPGHGGHDVGAVGGDGRYEKEATLAIARAVQQAIERSGVARAVLTRDDDRFIALGERVAIARRARGDMFVSIHCDSAPNVAARGATIYTLSDIASDTMAARVAARENKADALVSLPLGDEEPEVATILYDLARRRASNVASGFAGTLAATLAPEVPMTGNAHRFAGFRVLKTADMPAILFEAGYISNVDDARFLFSRDGQRAIGARVAAAVASHFAPRVAAAATSGPALP